MTIKPTPKRLAQIFLPAGLLAVSAAIASDDDTAAIGSLALVIIGISALITHIVERAIRDTTEERRRLQDSLSEVEMDRARYVALRARVDAEEERLCRQADRLEHDTKAQLARERAAMQAEFEDKYSRVKTEGFRLGVAYNDRGLLDHVAQPRVDAKVIRLPGRALGSSAGQGAYPPS